jgi:hypothetical protein
VIGQEAPFSIAPILLSLDLLHARGLSSSVGTVRQFDTLATALFGLSVLYWLCWGVRAFRSRLSNRDASRKLTALVILLLWLLAPIVFYLRSAHYLQLYYLIGQMPVHFILMGFSLAGAQSALEQAAQRIGQPGWRRAAVASAQVILPLPLIALLVGQTLFTLRFQDQRRRTSSGPTQVWEVREAIDVSREMLAARPECRLVAVSHGHSVDVSSLSLLREFVSRERVLLTDGRLAIPLVAPCGVYLDTQPGSAASALLARVATPVQDTMLETRGSRWRFAELPSDAQAQLSGELADSRPTAEWRNGLVLSKNERGTLRAGTTLPLTLTWSVEGPPPAIVYHFGTYLLAPENQIVAQSDGPGFDSMQWQTGDRFITWFNIPVPLNLPAGEYELAVVLYTWPGLKRASLLSGGEVVVLERLRYPT